MNKNSAMPVPPKLLQIVQETRNDIVTDLTRQFLNAFCDIFTFVQLNNSVVPVLTPNVGFAPSGVYADFMDFDGLVEDSGLKKFVRTRFEGEEPLSTEYVLVTVVRPGLRSREGANIYRREQIERPAQKGAANDMLRNSSDSQDLKSIMAALERALEKEIDLLPLETCDGSDLVRIIEELSQKHALECPKLLKDEASITRQSDCQVDVRNDPNRNVTDRTKPCMVAGKKIVVTIPVSGNISLLIGKPTSPNGLSGTLTLERDSIAVSYTKPFPIENVMLDRDIKNDINAISANMGFCTNEIELLNRELPSLIRKKIDRRLSSIEVSKHSFEGLSIPVKLGPEPEEVSPTVEPGTKRQTLPRGSKTSSKTTMSTASRKYDFDLFVCHASEDKADFVEPLAKELAVRGIKVWYDAFALKLGDSLRQKIDEGLRKSRFGLVILSPSFFQKQWTQRELDGLTEKEMRAGEKVIIPIWHNVSHDDVLEFSPPLADKLAGQSKNFNKLVDDIVDVIQAV